MLRYKDNTPPTGGKHIHSVQSSFLLGQGEGQVLGAALTSPTHSSVGNQKKWTFLGTEMNTDATLVDLPFMLWAISLGGEIQVLHSDILVEH